MIKRVTILVLICFFVASCAEMKGTQYGVKFRKLPTFLGGGVGAEASVLSPGQLAVLWPWDKIYRFDTEIKTISWGVSQDKDTQSGLANDYLYTRALDGNEVALAIEVEYQVSNDPVQLVGLVQNIATSDEKVAAIVKSVAEADIRSAMNGLETSQFIDATDRYSGVQRIRELMRSRLSPMGIRVVDVNLLAHKFERKHEVEADGAVVVKVDDSYEQMINEENAAKEQLEREKQRIDKVIAQKDKELAIADGEYEKVIAKAMGQVTRAKQRGVNYFREKDAEAGGIRAAGLSEIEGLRKQVKVFEGKGGEALLKLEIAKQLLTSNPKYVVLPNGASGGGIDVNRTDTNELISQIGVLEALKDNKKQ